MPGWAQCHSTVLRWPSLRGMPTLFYLVGPPASGKLTIGRYLAQMSGASLIDNHLINDPVFQAIGTERGEPLPEPAIRLAAQVGAITREAARRASPSVDHVFTNWLVDDPNDVQTLQDLRDLAAARQAVFAPVWLHCPEHELVKRVVQQERQLKSKLRDPQVLVRQLSEYAPLPAPPDALQLDTSTLSAQHAAERIATWAATLVPA